MWTIGCRTTLCLERRADGVQVAGFRAMASPCEILAQDVDPARLARVAGEVVAEVRRIERKFTRFGAAGVPAQLRRCAGRSARVDAETAMLIDIAALWHERSGGLFDITCGALQQLWRFGVATRPPTPDAVARVLPHVGFHRLRWTPPMLSMPPGMEIDLGGIGKEYAVDRAHDLLAAQLDTPALVNLGGDLRITRPLRRGHWCIGLESAEAARVGGRVVALAAGALATSGETRRHIVAGGVRYGHLLDPRTGWPVTGAPAAVSVTAPTCIEAGLLAKTALLQGPAAASYLAVAGARFWIASRQPAIPT